MEQKAWLERYEVETYVGNKSEYYLNKWGTYRSQKIKGFNIVALLFPIQWLGFRKLYPQVVLSYLFMLVMYFLGIVFYELTEILIYPIFTFLFMRLLAGIFFALLGNGIYREKILNCTLDYVDSREEKKYLEYLKKKGKPNLFLAVLLTLAEIWFYAAVLETMYEAINYTVTFVSF